MSSGGNTLSTQQVSAPMPRPVFIEMENISHPQSSGYKLTPQAIQILTYVVEEPQAGFISQTAILSSLQ